MPQLEQELHHEPFLNCQAPSAGEEQTGRNPRAVGCASGQQPEAPASQVFLPLEMRLAPLRLLRSPRTALPRARYLQKTLDLPHLCNSLLEIRRKHTHARIVHLVTSLIRSTYIFTILSLLYSVFCAIMKTSEA